MDTYEYYKGLIAFRKAHGALRMAIVSSPCTSTIAEIPATDTVPSAVPTDVVPAVLSLTQMSHVPLAAVVAGILVKKRKK